MWCAASAGARVSSCWPGSIGSRSGARRPAHPSWKTPRPPILQDFGDFCYALADRYKGKIAAYQVWNEPNLAREWGNQPPNPAQYVELLKVCYQRHQSPPILTRW